jgi:hypothetical protein
MKYNPYILALSLAAFAGCVPKEPDPDPSIATFQTTCGDPVCRGFSPDPNTPLCTTETEGDSCTEEGTVCAIPDDACNAKLICAEEDPKANGCPISLRSKKTEIHYLKESDERLLSEALFSMKLADWRYLTEPSGTKHHLGFIIDDLPKESPAVLPRGDQVNMYGYTSMAVAALKTQQNIILEQKKKLEEQDARLKSLEERLSKLEKSR